MPELPDVVVYVEALTRHVGGRRLERVLLLSPFVLRTVDPPITAIHGSTVAGVRRIGKRIALEFQDSLFLVMHLMIAGRLRWRPTDPAAARGLDGAPGRPPAVRTVLAVFEFEHGTLFFTEAGSKKRASIHMVRGDAAVAAVGRGGVEPLDATLEQFHDALTRENHTVKRALTDPRLLSGIGNAYSDEILHAARLSPLTLTRVLTDADVLRLYDAMRTTLTSWVERLRAEASAGFPEKVTAFHDAMAVHGRYNQPCPVCGSPVQRIVYAANECNYCARCQTGGRLLADRSLSRLLKADWPRSIDDL
jgi:formamidopyrimidine-DNA glycosylase